MPASWRTRLLYAVSALILFIFVGFASFLTAASATAADDDTGGIGLTVTVEPAPATSPSLPTPVPTTTTTTTVRPSTGGNGAYVPPTVVSTTPLANTGEKPAAGEYDLGGVVFLSGLSSNYNPSFNPLGGSMTIQFTVRNVSDAALDAKTKFWITGPANNTLGEARVPVRALAAGETRTVTADVPGVGQWGAIGTHMTFTPPTEVDGVKLAPVTRDGFSIATPIYITSAALIALAALAILSLMGRLNVFALRIPA